MTRASTTLKALLRGGRSLVMPDAYDPLGAMLIARAEFPAVQCSGYSMAAANGYPEETNLSYSENLETTRKIVNAVPVPVMADGEDGFGDARKLAQAVREFIRIGAVGMNIEDQVLGRWTAGRGVVEPEELVAKLRLARAAATAEGVPDFVLNARTDALAAAEDRDAGLEEAVRRAALYLDAGADLAFVLGVRTLAEVEHLLARIPGPLSIAAGMPYNVREFSVADLVRRGVARVSLPTLLLFSAVDGLGRALEGLHGGGLLDEEGAAAQAAGFARLRGLHAG